MGYQELQNKGVELLIEMYTADNPAYADDVRRTAVNGVVGMELTSPAARKRFVAWAARLKGTTVEETERTFGLMQAACDPDSGPSVRADDGRVLGTFARPADAEDEASEERACRATMKMFAADHPEHADDIKFETLDGRWNVWMKPAAMKTFVAWSAKLGVVSPDKAIELTGFMQQMETHPDRPAFRSSYQGRTDGGKNMTSFLGD